MNLQIRVPGVNSGQSPPVCIVKTDVSTVLIDPEVTLARLDLDLFPRFLKSCCFQNKETYLCNEGMRSKLLSRIFLN